jgi:NDP-sugar pyrophosphorylase family protein
VNYSFDGPQLLGTGGAIKRAQNLLSKDFVVAYGDSFLFLNIGALFNSHLQEKKPLTFSVLKNRNQGDRSNVFWDGHRVKYDKFHPSPDMEYIDYGLSIINKDYFLKSTPPGAFDLADFLTTTCDKNQAHVFEAKIFFQEIGSPEGYRNFCKMMEGSKFDLKALAHTHSLL